MALPQQEHVDRGDLIADFPSRAATWAPIWGFARAAGLLIAVAAASALSWSSFSSGLATKEDLAPLFQGMQSLQVSMGSLEARESARLRLAAEDSDCLVEKLEFRRLTAAKRGTAPAKSAALLDCEKIHARRLQGRD